MFNHCTIKYHLNNKSSEEQYVQQNKNLYQIFCILKTGNAEKYMHMVPISFILPYIVLNNKSMIQFAEKMRSNARKHVSIKSKSIEN
ncbi:hypothetical protein T09_7055 [Trichinella sp. T9]|nr:hypothetical protein T09_7055 [Trichinella sp. T9]